MGLAGGPNGAKALFKHKFPDAFRSFQALEQARDAVGVARKQTLVVVDGNVLVMQTPAAVDTFPGYVAVLANQLHGAIKAGEHVVVVFDEPASLTRAKQEEQSKRDSRRAPQTPVCSDDLVPCPRDDNYTREELDAEGLNVRLLINHRPARSRFYDALCVAALAKLRATLVGEEGCAWSVTFDGIDSRGADRPLGEKRRPGVLSSHPEEWAPVLTREHAIGEGDMKLTDVCHRVHKLRKSSPDAAMGDVLLNLLWTIDTDSFLIELMQQSRREMRPRAEDRNELTMLCLREPARRRKGEVPEPAYFQCIDMMCFHESVMTYVFGSRSVTPALQEKKPLVTALLAASIALCGCDFVEVRGLRADLVLPCVREVARNQPELLELMHGVYTGRAEDTRNAGEAIKAVIEDFLTSIAGAPRMKATSQKASSYSDLQVLRACWLAAYWNGNEFKNVRNWGFLHASNDNNHTTATKRPAEGPPLVDLTTTTAAMGDDNA